MKDMREHPAPQWMRLLMWAAGTCGFGTVERRIGVHQKWNRLVRYGFAGVLALIGVGLRLLTHLETNNDSLRMISIIVVALAAWLGGFGPGILATLIGLAGSLYISSEMTPEPLIISHFFRFSLFALTGFIVSALTEALTRTTLEWRRAEEAHENRILQERNRMAREIHDTLAQGLTGILIQLEAADDILQQTAENNEVAAHLYRARDLARVSLAEARRSVSALRPLSLERQSLPDALGDRIDLMTSGTGIKTVLTVEGEPFPLLADSEDNLLRIGLEAVTNALRHAQTDIIYVQLAFSRSQVLLSVRDKGTGFLTDAPPTGKGFGLDGMRERTKRIGGTFALESVLNEGTEVRVTVPRDLETAAADHRFPKNKGGHIK